MTNNVVPLASLVSKCSVLLLVENEDAVTSDPSAAIFIGALGVVVVVVEVDDDDVVVVVVVEEERGSNQ
jgi:hypothetical protein